MEKKKLKKKKVTYRTDEQQEIRKFLIIIAVIVVCVGGVYLFTRVFVTKDLNKTDDFVEEVIPGNINYNVTIVGELLDRPYKEYYVMAYDASKETSMKYQAVYSAYASKQEKDLTKLYFLDLGNIMNEAYVAKDKEKSNPEVQDIKDLKLGEFTLIKVKGGKIVKYIEGMDEIKKELKIGE